MEDPDLENLLEAWRGGDLHALGKIVEHTRKPLFGYIYGMVHDVHAAEDVFQDVWLRALRKLHRFQSDKLRAWLFRIARNRVIDLTRKRKPDASLEQPVGGGAREPATLSSFIASELPGPDRNTGNAELGERIRAAVAVLPPEQREVFLLRMESGLPFKEIATLQKTSINTALARMQYALRKLRETLAADHAELPSGRGKS